MPNRRPRGLKPAKWRAPRGTYFTGPVFVIHPFVTDEGKLVGSDGAPWYGVEALKLQDQQYRHLANPERLLQLGDDYYHKPLPLPEPDPRKPYWVRLDLNLRWPRDVLMRFLGESIVHQAERMREADKARLRHDVRELRNRPAAQGRRPLSAVAIARKLKVPEHHVREILHRRPPRKGGER